MKTYLRVMVGRPREPVVEPNLWKRDYRHHMLEVKQLTTHQLFLGVKPVEVVYYLHPRRLWRILAASDRDPRRQLCFSSWHPTAAFRDEVREQIAGQLRRRVSTP